MFRRKPGRIFPTWRRFVEKSKRSGRNRRRHAAMEDWAAPAFSAVTPGDAVVSRPSRAAMPEAGGQFSRWGLSRRAITRTGPTRRAERVRDRRAVRGGSG